MLVLVAAWAALSLLVGFAVVKATRRADSPQLAAPPTGARVTRSASTEPGTRRPSTGTATTRPSGGESTTGRAG
jgi:hypothetical protein